MKHPFLVLVLAAACLPPSAMSPAFGQPSPSPEERITLKTMVGTVSVRTPESNRWRDARPGMPLRMKWDLRTFTESSAELEFETGTIVRVGENSLVTISRALLDKKDNSSQTAVSVKSGEIWANVKKLASKNSDFTFETQTAVASIRGTRLGVAVQKGATKVDVYEGVVEVTKRGSNRPVTARNLTRVVVTAEREEPQVFQFSQPGAPGAAADRKNDGQPPMLDPFAPSEGARKDSTAAPSDSGKTPPQPPAQGTPGQQGALQEPQPPLSLEVLFPTPGTISDEAQTVVTGKTAPDALARVGAKETPVGTDGYFSAVFALKPGPNTIPVAVKRGEQVIQRSVTVEFHPPLLLEVSNLVDNMQVQSAEIEIDVRVTEGATFSVNGAVGQTRVSLKPGSNRIAVSAADKWGAKAEKSYTVVLAAATGFSLNVTTPRDNGTVTAPLIVVSGSVSPPGAVVEVNGIEVAASTGFFTHQMPLPDEPGQYDVTVVAKSGERDLTVRRAVVYQPPKQPLSLTITSPAQGEVIRSRSIKLSGITLARAKVQAAGRPVNVAPSGVFSLEIPVTERDIGDYTLNVSARTDEEDMDQNVGVVVDIASPGVNTSLPMLVVADQTKRATRTGAILVQVLDRTPEDQLTLYATINGSTAEYTTTSGSTERVALEEGKNEYSFRAVDKAKNASNVVSGVLYYLPGKISINFVSPQASPYTIRGLPPLPRGVDPPLLDIDLEVQDGINDVPESILYCRLLGDGKDVQLKNNRDYTFTGQIELQPNRNVTFSIEVEDIAGNRCSKPLQVIFTR